MQLSLCLMGQGPDKGPPLDSLRHHPHCGSVRSQLILSMWDLTGLQRSAQISDGHWRTSLVSLSGWSRRDQKALSFMRREGQPRIRYSSPQERYSQLSWQLSSFRAYSQALDGDLLCLLCNSNGQSWCYQVSKKVCYLATHPTWAPCSYHHLSTHPPMLTYSPAAVKGWWELPRIWHLPQQVNLSRNLLSMPQASIDTKDLHYISTDAKQTTAPLLSRFFLMLPKTRAATGTLSVCITSAVSLQRNIKKAVPDAANFPGKWSGAISFLWLWVWRQCLYPRTLAAAQT